MKKFLLKLIPNGVREQMKLFYYNNAIKDFSFSKMQGLYKTNSGNNWSVLTKSPLYFIVRDVKRYEKYYTVSPGDIVIDAGANEGVLSLIYSKKITETGRIYSFEPDERNVDKFQENLKNNTGTENIILKAKGLWKESGKIPFFEMGTVASSIFTGGKDALEKEIDVISIDDFIAEQKLHKLNFVKMDIEGAEIGALEGALGTIEKFRPNFAIASYHLIDNEKTYKKLEAFFRKIKFPYKTVFFEDGEIITYAGPDTK